ncbi:ABC transporter substrate-binding protein [Chromobacterium sp. IIBBL 290-4]|uniref:substrate-binding periplasmic protein n=1 Tax=Chromobacterium sp. IIBBL 290-4 TaxID=2953890 RepID=UPI0020B890C6|nr:transporter substrate-binding domain-containing protein [Chromobacterium sp. IIBBL 290-4]UTH72495.1 transporter substrate-binding domain-containing protein [Chromobacterium sp. IIBBL 290-4]
MRAIAAFYLPSMPRLLLALAWLSPMSALAAPPLRIAVSDALTSPYVIEDPSPDAPPRGRAIELARQSLAHCGQAGDFQRLPGERIVQNLSLGRIDSALLLSYKAERADRMAYPLRKGQADPAYRMATFDYAFYVRKDSPLRWDGHYLSGLQTAVGINQGWSIGQDLLARGLPVEESHGIPDNFAKLQAGRIDAYALHQLAGDLYLRHHPELKIRRLSPPLKGKTYYWVFSRDFAARHPETTACLWRQLPKLRERYLPERASSP